MIFYFRLSVKTGLLFLEYFICPQTTARVDRISKVPCIFSYFMKDLKFTDLPFIWNFKVSERVLFLCKLKCKQLESLSVKCNHFDININLILQSVSEKTFSWQRREDLILNGFRFFINRNGIIKIHCILHKYCLLDNIYEFIIWLLSSTN